MSVNAKVAGNIAILSLDGRYMKVTASNGLAFGDQTLDNRSKFSVVPASDGKIQLIGMTVLRQYVSKC
jgi:hypothetical protein